MVEADDAEFSSLSHPLLSKSVGLQSVSNNTAKVVFFDSSIQENGVCFVKRRAIF